MPTTTNHLQRLMLEQMGHKAMNTFDMALRRSARRESNSDKEIAVFYGLP